MISHVTGHSGHLSEEAYQYRLKYSPLLVYLIYRAVRKYRVLGSGHIRDHQMDAAIRSGLGCEVAGGAAQVLHRQHIGNYRGQPLLGLEIGQVSLQDWLYFPLSPNEDCNLHA